MQGTLWQGGKAHDDAPAKGPPGVTGTLDEDTLKRLRMRSWRRGMKEMDLILGPFADAELGRLGPDELTLYEQLLSENDQDLYFWVANAGPAPERYAAIIRRLRDFHALS